MEEKRYYFAFISYQRQDEEWAKWLAHELEHYHFPTTLNGHPNLPKDLRPIFRDTDELSAGNLPDQIHKALTNSKHLIVICSPRSARSKWVNKEIEEFVSFGKTNKIFPFIIDGKAFAEDPSEECFPPALINLPKEDERLGGNINEMGRDAAVVKIVAGMLDLDFDSLWQRYEREKAEEERRKQEERNRLLKVHSLYLSEKANQLLDDHDGYTAKLLALEALPKNIDDPDRPYVGEAEFALRAAVDAHSFTIRHKVRLVTISPDGQKIVTVSDNNELSIWNKKDGVIERKLNGHSGRICCVLYSPDGMHIISTARDGCINIWNSQTGELIRSLQESKLKEEIACKTIRCVPRMCSSSTKNQTKLDNFMSFFNSYSHEEKITPSPQTNVGTYDFMFSPINIPQTENKSETPYSTDISVSADGKMIASVGPYRNVLVWNTETGEILSVFESPKWPNNVVSISPSGEKLFVASGFISSQQYLSVWDVPHKQLLFSIETESMSVNSAVFSEDEDDILIAYSDSVKILDSDTGEVEETIQMKQHNPKYAYYSNDYHDIITASEKSIDIWDLKTLELRKTLGTHAGEIESMAVSSGSKTIVSCSEGGIVKIWDYQDGNCLSEKRCQNKISKANFDKSNIKYDIGNIEDVCCVDYSPNGRYMLIGITNETIKILSTQTGTQVYSIDAGYFDNAYFEGDGEQIVAVTRYDSRIWAFPPLQDIIDQTREQLRNRALTSEERKKYYLV